MNTIPRFKGKIESDTDPGVFYVVDMVEDHWVCTCPAKMAKGDKYACKHILRFQEAIKVALNERAKDTAPPKLRKAAKAHGKEDKPVVLGEKYDFGPDQIYGRVTSILGEVKNPQGLIKWGARMAAEAIFAAQANGIEIEVEEAAMAPFYYRKSKAKIGTSVHDFIELLNDNPEQQEELIKKLTPAERPYAYAFINWVSKEGRENIVHIDAERPVFSKKHGYAGKFDWLVSLHGKTTLLDFKTSKWVDDDYGLQLRAYKEAILEMKLIDKIDAMAILHLKPDMTFEYIQKDEPLDVFLAAVKIWKWRDKKKNGGGD